MLDTAANRITALHAMDRNLTCYQPELVSKPDSHLDPPATFQRLRFTPPPYGDFAPRRNTRPQRAIAMRSRKVLSLPSSADADQPPEPDVLLSDADSV